MGKNSSNNKKHSIARTHTQTHTLAQIITQIGFNGLHFSGKNRTEYTTTRTASTIVFSFHFSDTIRYSHYALQSSKRNFSVVQTYGRNEITDDERHKCISRRRKNGGKMQTFFEKYGRKKKQQRTPHEWKKNTSDWVSERDGSMQRSTHRIEWKYRIFRTLSLPICNTPFELAFGNRVVVRACVPFCV